MNYTSRLLQFMSQLINTEPIGPSPFLDILFHQHLQLPASNSPPSPLSNTVSMGELDDHHISQAQCLPTVPSARHFAPPIDCHLIVPLISFCA